MPGKTIIIKEDTFYPFIKKYHPKFNIERTDILEDIKNRVFSLDKKCHCANDVNKIIVEYLKEHGIKNYSKFDKEYWKIYGWSTDYEISMQIEKFLCSNKAVKEYVTCYNFVSKLNAFLGGDLNMDNKDFIEVVRQEIFKNDLVLPMNKFKKLAAKNTIYKYKSPKKVGSSIWSLNYWLSRGYTEEEANIKISDIQKKNSKRSVEYYINRGYSYDDAVCKVSEEQRKNVSCSKKSSEYWIKKGFTKEEAKSIASDIARKHSVWSKSYWMNQGYTEEEAANKVLEYNCMSITCKKFNNNLKEFYYFRKNHAAACKLGHANGYKRAASLKLKQGNCSNVSNAEKHCFEVLKEWNSNVVHESYTVYIPEDFTSMINVYFYVCDGYIAVDNNVIIIEYDGKVWHKEDRDIVRDREILSIDNNILGIIRLKESYFSNNDIIFNYESKKEEFNNAIQKITNTTEDRIILS